jgi:hypothetical protein
MRYYEQCGKQCLILISIFFYFSYRTREEIQDVRKSRDPITSFRDKLIQANLATDEEFKVCSILFFFCQISIQIEKFSFIEY